jgi:hypothetical protein
MRRWSRRLFNRRGHREVARRYLGGQAWRQLGGGARRGRQALGQGERELGRRTRDEGRRTKEAAEEKEDIHIMKPSFCAERLWPGGMGGGGFYVQGADMASEICFSKISAKCFHSV